MTQWTRVIFVLFLFLAIPSPGRAATWSVVPPVAYPESTKIGSSNETVTTYSMTVLLDGAKFTTSGNPEYWLRFDGKAPLLACQTGAPAPAKDPPDLTKCVVSITFLNDGTQAAFSRIPADLAGARKFSIVPAHTTTAETPSGKLEIAFALYSAFAVRILALVFIAILTGVVLVVLNAGHGHVLSSGSAVGLARMVLIDPDTRTYSLSKLQAYVWGFAVVAGYIYLTMARSLVQGAFDFAAIPGNLPMLMGISLGTSVVSVGVAGLAGNKGSGDVAPMPSDLITSGGVVAPERLMHLLWSIIGGASFVLFAFSIPPDAINSLPEVPSGFLELMGVSAAGYVGGKIARGPGPNIQGIVMDPPNGGAAGTAVTPLPIQIDGANLATEGATYLLAQVTPAPGAATPVQFAQPFRAGSVVDAAKKTATRIRTSIAPVAPALTFAVGNRYRLTVVNPDGEKAAWEFDVT